LKKKEMKKLPEGHPIKIILSISFEIEEEEKLD
jgi:hypothetical protein